MVLPNQRVFISCTIDLSSVIGKRPQLISIYPPQVLCKKLDKAEYELIHSFPRAYIEAMKPISGQRHVDECDI